MPKSSWKTRLRSLGARPEDRYDGSYFGEGRDPGGDREGHSGYARYDRTASNADIAGWVLWRNFQVTHTLDVGCATGYLVEVLRERGLEARGCDVSAYAIDHAAPGAEGHIEVGNLVQGLGHPDGAFELISALEVLEHLTPKDVPAALAELRRLCGGFVVATIPSFGKNLSGPDGHVVGKVLEGRVAFYQALGHGFEGPVPFADLEIDADGQPIEGHLTIASYEWWTARFAEAGFERHPEIERRLYADIQPARLVELWNLYVFALPGVDPALSEQREPDRSLRELGLVHPLIEHYADEP